MDGVLGHLEVFGDVLQGYPGFDGHWHGLSDPGVDPIKRKRMWIGCSVGRQACPGKWMWAGRQWDLDAMAYV